MIWQRRLNRCRRWVFRSSVTASQRGTSNFPFCGHPLARSRMDRPKVQQLSPVGMLKVLLRCSSIAEMSAGADLNRSDRKAVQTFGKVAAHTTDGLRSYGAAMDELGNREKQHVGRWANNRVENSHLPFRQRERSILRFRQMKSSKKFASVRASLHNHFF